MIFLLLLERDQLHLEKDKNLISVNLILKPIQDHPNIKNLVYGRTIKGNKEEKSWQSVDPNFLKVNQVNTRDHMSTKSHRNSKKKVLNLVWELKLLQNIRTEEWELNLDQVSIRYQAYLKKVIITGVNIETQELDNSKEQQEKIWISILAHQDQDNITMNFNI